MLKLISRGILALLGWQLDERLPPERRFLIIGAFHTSNWDFPLGLLGMWALGLKARWIAKHTLFMWPLGPIMKALGGIPVDRRASSGFIDHIASIYAQRKRLVIAIAPEGTRSRTGYWRTGFYYIALAAKIPVALGYLDYPNKRLGVGGMFYPSGDIVADMTIIREFYRDKTGLRPGNQGEIRVRAEEE